MLSSHVLGTGLATFFGMWCLFLSGLAPLLALERLATQPTPTLAHRAKHLEPRPKLRVRRATRITPGARAMPPARSASR